MLIRLWLVPWLGRYALDALGPEPIQEMLLTHHKKVYAGGTLNRVRALLVHGYMRDFVERFLNNEKAKTVVEYSLIAVMIAFTAAFVAFAGLLFSPQG